MVSDVYGIHEGTSRRLPHLAERIALVRGAPIVSYGSVTLLVRDAEGRPERAMEADETLYLHPRRAATPEKSLIVGEHDFPDVVLEVDYTTDVRPGKLLVYEAWGVPELWVVVPPAGAARRRPAGVTIHRLDDGRYRSGGGERRVSRLDGGGDLRRTDRTGADRRDVCRVLERVGRALGAREGTGPDDDPLLRSLGERKLAEGITRGRAEGIAQGRGRGAGGKPCGACCGRAGFAVSDTVDELGAGPCRRAARYPDGCWRSPPRTKRDFWRRVESPLR